MGVANIRVPATQLSFYDTVSAKANINKIERLIRPTYGQIIKSISSMTNVPERIIEAFIFIESAGNANAQTPYAVGLMQLSPATASDALVTEKGADRLSVPEQKLLKKYLGSRYDTILSKVKKGQKSTGATWITRDELLNPEFNVLVGTIYLKQLMDEFTQPDGSIDMDKVVVIYNTGRFGKVAKQAIAFKGKTDELIQTLPKETSSYIVKLLGKQGILDSLA